MKRRLFGTLWSLLPPLLASTATADTLTVNIARVPSDDGKIMVAVLGSEQQFTDDSAPPVAATILAAKSGTVTYVVHDLTPGEYGVRVMHDQNENQKMDSNFVGMPKEPWGFSNNALGSFGPPSWQDVKFSVSGDTDITINLNH
ncbi:MAG: DUF2141 domain-containing protein [Pseudomonadales bacterium]|jgi:uncharacterized protein (DUF2141 family)|nr:DUF2141 domain-containing protein [Pseudomonadales bacterium]MDP6470177.1 DUF2141 domain-containing protein [Pseudomonadales bacterium]MDP6827083.1 DUF2141 domain-containing protein [Pseudomonadales bacterium]MDP6972759.1 DUF2141 domain-containing protein [Pseudomonadales bacterium]|tara:strand:+ start:2360 stop:2791 length:432 start_codon:yes stop_codon:yes gene_type:complete